MRRHKGIGFPKDREIDMATVRRLLLAERNDLEKRKVYLQDNHSMIKHQIARGMSRQRAEQVWGKDMVKDALDSEGIQTLAAE